MTVAEGLPVAVRRTLDDFVAAATQAFGDTLRAVVLFGSAADGRLRATSDVNVIVVLSRFDRGRADGVREALRTGRAAVRLAVMFLLEAEIADAFATFPDKFLDVERRHRVLYGADPFTGVQVPRAAVLGRLRESLLNLTLRLRERYVARSLVEEQALLAVADAAGPLRASAMTLVALEGRPAASPKAALEQVAAELDGDWAAVLAHVSAARERAELPAGVAGPTLLRLSELAARMRERAGRLR